MKNILSNILGEILSIYYIINSLINLLNNYKKKSPISWAFYLVNKFNEVCLYQDILLYQYRALGE